MLGVQLREACSRSAIGKRTQERRLLTPIALQAGVGMVPEHARVDATGTDNEPALMANLGQLILAAAWVKVLQRMQCVGLTHPAWLWIASQSG